MKEFDPYHEWLGIPPKDQPPHHYRLLGLDLFEADPQIIERASDRQRNYVKQFQTGAYGPRSQRLLNELTKATICLLDPVAKGRYDEKLRSSLQPPEPAKTQSPAESPTPQPPAPDGPVLNPVVPAQPIPLPLSHRPIPLGPMQPLPAPAMMPTAPILRPLPLPPHLVPAPSPPPALPRPASAQPLPQSIRVNKAKQRSPTGPATLVLLAGGAVVVCLALVVIFQVSKADPTPAPKKLAAGSNSSPGTTTSKTQPKRETSPANNGATGTKPIAASKIIPPPKPPLEAPPVTETKQPPATIASPEPEVSQPFGVKTLVEARAEYQREKTQFSQAVSADLAKREAAAQSSGDAESIKQAMAARESLASGMIPKDAPGKDLIELMVAREMLAKALQRELQNAQEKDDESQMATLQKEFTEFMVQESADIGDVNWRFPECTFRMVNVATGLAMAAKNEGNGAMVIQKKEDPTDPLQQWYVRFPGTGHSRVRLRSNNRNLNVPAADRASGRGIIMWDERNSANGNWELQYRGTYYHVRSLFSGKLLSVPNANKSEGQQLVQWPHHDSPDDQKWKLIRVLEDEAK